MRACSACRGTLRSKHIGGVWVVVRLERRTWPLQGFVLHSLFAGSKTPAIKGTARRRLRAQSGRSEVTGCDVTRLAVFRIPPTPCAVLLLHPS